MAESPERLREVGVEWEMQDSIKTLESHWYGSIYATEIGMRLDLASTLAVGDGS